MPPDDPRAPAWRVPNPEPSRAPEPPRPAVPPSPKRLELPPPTSAQQPHAVPEPALLPGSPALLPYRSGLPVPTGYHVESRVSRGLVISGGVTLALAYLTGVGVGLKNGFDRGTGWLALPLAGPWAAMGARDTDCKIRDNPGAPDQISAAIKDARKCFEKASDEATAIALLAGDGIIQVVGLALIVAGIADQTQELVRDDIQVSVLPRLNGGVDLGFTARF